QTNSGILVGDAATATLVSPVEPSTDDVAAGLRYAFALDVDTTGSATYATSGTSSSVNFGLIAEGTHTVYARILDKDGGSTSYSAPLGVLPLSAALTITSTLDDGSVGTLRWAVGNANSHPGPDTIVFDPGMFGTPQTITLTGGQFVLSDTATTT